MVTGSLAGVGKSAGHENGGFIEQFCQSGCILLTEVLGKSFELLQGAFVECVGVSLSPG